MARHNPYRIPSRCPRCKNLHTKKYDVPFIGRLPALLFCDACEKSIYEADHAMSKSIGKKMLQEKRKRERLEYARACAV